VQLSCTPSETPFQQRSLSSAPLYGAGQRFFVDALVFFAGAADVRARGAFDATTGFFEADVFDVVAVFLVRFGGASLATSERFAGARFAPFDEAVRAGTLERGGDDGEAVRDEAFDVFAFFAASGA
jgi:hypothetical protein